MELQDFEVIVSRYWSSIYRFILASVRDVDASRSLTQDCFLRAYHKRDSFRGQAGYKTWLMKIAVNLVYDFERNRKHRFWKRVISSGIDSTEMRDHLPDVRISPEDQASMNEQVRMIWKVSRSLPERQRTVFLLRFVEDMDILEIAAATGMKEGTVKIHLFRALRTVRERLGVLR